METEYIKCLAADLRNISHRITSLANTTQYRDECQKMINDTITLNRAAFALEKLMEEQDESQNRNTPDQFNTSV